MMETAVMKETKIYRWTCPVCHFTNDVYDEHPEVPAKYACEDCAAIVTVSLYQGQQYKTPGEKRAAVVARIRKLRDKGNTLCEIAKILNEENIKTFSGKGIWHAQTLHSLLKRS